MCGGKLAAHFDLLCLGIYAHEVGPSSTILGFFAAYEHMTHAERREALSKAWNLLAPGGAVAIVECPNRLWFFDNHTSLLPFYHWLPDEIAVEYAAFSNRESFRSRMAGSDEQLLQLARSGRGASFHDLELVLGPIASLKVSEGLTDYRRLHEPDIDAAYGLTTLFGRYRASLMEAAPSIPSAFFYPWLDVIIEKP